jgi:hypothetical protein
MNPAFRWHCPVAPVGGALFVFYLQNEASDILSSPDPSGFNGLRAGPVKN